MVDARVPESFGETPGQDIQHDVFRQYLNEGYDGDS